MSRLSCASPYRDASSSVRSAPLPEHQIMFSCNKDHKVQLQSAKDNERVKDELELYMKRMKH